MKKTRILAIVMSVFILASCASSSDVVDGGMFQKRKYNKGWHINTKSKVNNSGAVKTEVDEVLYTQEVTKDNFEQKTEVAENIALSQELKSNELLQNEAVVSSLNESKEKAVAKTVNAEQNAPEVAVETKIKSSFESNSRLNKVASKLLNSKAFSNNEIAQNKQTTDKNLLNLILAVLLVVAIIMLLSFIDGMLGGLLSLVLLIVIIILLLRYFGVV